MPKDQKGWYLQSLVLHVYSGSDIQMIKTIARKFVYANNEIESWHENMVRQDINRRVTRERKRK